MNIQKLIALVWCQKYINIAIKKFFSLSSLIFFGDNKNNTNPQEEKTN